MPIKQTITTSDGSDYPYKLTSSWGYTFDDTNLSKRVLEANTETGYTVIQYYVNETAQTNWQSTNDAKITGIQTQKSANSITHAVADETVDTIP